MDSDPYKEDRELAEQLSSGSEAAFLALLDRFEKPVFAYLYRMLGQAQAAEDTAQETFIKIHQNRKHYRPGKARLSSWVFQVGRNTALDLLKKQARHPEQELEHAPEPADPSTPDRELQLKETGDRIALAVQQLPEDQRTAILLSEYQGLSMREIAEVMDSSEKSVESRLYRARQALRTSLADLF